MFSGSIEYRDVETDVVLSRNYDTLLRYEEVAGASGEIVKDEPFTQIRRIDFHGCPAYIKVNWNNPLVRLRTIGASDRGGREYRMLRRCSELGISVPRPLAHGVRRTFWGVVLESFVIVEAFEDAEPLSSFLRREGERVAHEPQFRTLVSNIAREIRTIHSNGIYYIRPTTKDILIRRTAHDAPFEYRLLDLPTAQRGVADWWVLRGQQKDIAALLSTVRRYAGVDVVDAFLDGYLPDPLGKTREELKTLIDSGIQRRDTRERRRRFKSRIRRWIHAVRDPRRS